MTSLQLTTDQFHLRPVMVWFHQGSYAFDSGNEANYGPGYLMDVDVVLVTLNYRLDVFGECLKAPSPRGGASADAVALLMQAS